jgi:tRNA-dihydrouridine synthase 1
MSITKPINIYLFLRVQQNTCSSSLEIIPFFSEIHYKQELIYISNLSKFNEKDAIFSDGFIDDRIVKIFPQVQPITNIDFIKLQQKKIIIFLQTVEWIQKILDQNIATQVYIIRHEGDFPITGKEIPCDCGDCLLNSLANKEITYKYIATSSMQYYDGYQYTTLQYNYVPAETILATSISQKYRCKKNPFKSITMPPKFEPEIDLQAYQKYQTIGSPCYISAPMIGQSELAFRMMVRNNGVQLCYTPMINAEIFVTNPEYQHELFTTCAEDRPLVVQIAANDPKKLLQAAQMVANQCDAIDINLGCPQPIARRHHYGSWLMEDWELIYKLIRILKENLSIPVWCKIRIFELVNETIAYAKMLENAGCSLLTIHGRLRKSTMNAEPADWQHIAAVRKTLQIPVFANGSIATYKDAKDCLAVTGCDGVMAASGLLENPSLFTNITKTPKLIALEYLEYAEKYHALMRYVRAHVLQILSKIELGPISTAIQQAETITELRKLLHKNELNTECTKQSSNSFQAVFDGFSV